MYKEPKIDYLTFFGTDYGYKMTMEQYFQSLEINYFFHTNFITSQTYLEIMGKIIFQT